MKRYDNYKSSGIEWIGEIPEHWTKIALRHLVSEYKAGPFGSSLITSQLLETGEILVYTPEHIAKHEVELQNNLYLPIDRKEEMCQFLVTTGDVLIPIVGTLGRALIINNSMPSGIINQRLAKFKLRRNHVDDKFFLYYFVESQIGQIYNAQQSRGSIIVNLTKQIIYDMPFLLPPLPEQQAIADYLDKKCGEIDRSIAKQQRRIELLEELKQSVITQAVTRGLDPSVSLRDSGIEWIGEIPEHWKVCKLKYGYSFSTGGTPPTHKSEYFEGDIPWANISDLNGGVVFDTNKHITQEAVNSCSMQLSKKGNLMYSFKLSVGEVAFCGRDMYTNEAIATFGGGTNSLRYLFYMAPIYIIYNANTNIYGASLLNQDLINNAWITIPSLSEQQAIADYLDKRCAEIDSMIEREEEKIELMQELKQSIITEVVTGKRKVV